MTHVLGMLAAIALTAFCWGVYGPVLHFGRDYMESALRPFVCVGLAYFLIVAVARWGKGWLDVERSYVEHALGCGWVSWGVRSYSCSYRWR